VANCAAGIACLGLALGLSATVAGCRTSRAIVAASAAANRFGRARGATIRSPSTASNPDRHIWDGEPRAGTAHGRDPRGLAQVCVRRHPPGRRRDARPRGLCQRIGKGVLHRGGGSTDPVHDRHVRGTAGSVCLRSWPAQGKTDVLRRCPRTSQGTAGSARCLA
jgi:hypothetical protein